MTEEREAPDRDLFNHWVVAMEDVLEEFIDEKAVEISEQLDYSPASLPVLENWLLERYAAIKDLDPDSDIWDGASRYVGEVFRMQLGGYWDLEDEDPKDVYYGLPILTGFENLGAECPHTCVTAALDRRTGKFFSNLLAHYIEEEKGEELKF